MDVTDAGFSPDGMLRDGVCWFSARPLMEFRCCRTSWPQPPGGYLNGTSGFRIVAIDEMVSFEAADWEAALVRPGSMRPRYLTGDWAVSDDTWMTEPGV